MPIPLRFKTRSAEIDRRFPKSLYMTMCRDALVRQVRYGNGRMSPMARASKTVIGSVVPSSIGPAVSATMAIKLIERNAHVCFKLITRTTITWKASRSESKKQYGNQLFHFLPPYSTQMTTSIFLGLYQAKFGVSFVHTSSLPTLQLFSLDYPQQGAGTKSVCG